MKLINLLVIALVAIIIMSCGPYYEESYSLSEMRTLVSIGQAAEKADSIAVDIDEYTTIKYPIIQMDECGYYPGLSKGSGVRYYLVK